MGKGSKPRPKSITADEFWDNWDRVFGDKEDEPRADYECSKCGGLDFSEVHQEAITDYEPQGDTSYPRTEVYLTCEHCGNDVEDNT